MVEVTKAEETESGRRVQIHVARANFSSKLKRPTARPSVRRVT